MTTTTHPQVQIDDQEPWQAVEARDSRFDGQFVYAVKSTGVYCRPPVQAVGLGRPK